MANVREWIRPRKQLLLLEVFLFLVAAMFLLVLYDPVTSARFTAASPALSAVGTIALALFTLMLLAATAQMGNIEHQRDIVRKAEQRKAIIRQKLHLTENMIGWNVDAWPHQILLTHVPRTDFLIFRELVLILDYAVDTPTKDEVQGIVGWMDKIDQGVQLDPVPMQNFIESVKAVREKLVMDVPRWRAEVIG